MKREDEIHSENYRKKQELELLEMKRRLSKMINNIIPFFIFVVTIISLIATFIMMGEVNNDLAILYIWASFTIVCLCLITYIYNK